MAYADRRKERINKIISEVYKRIDSDILSEATPGVKIGIDNLGDVDADQLSKIATKTNINVVDQVQEANDTDVKDVTAGITIANRKVYVSANWAKPGEQVEFTSKKGDVTFTAIVGDEKDGHGEYILKDIKKVTTPEETPSQTDPEQDKEEKEVASTQQENAVFNLKNWAVQLQVPVNEGEPTMNGAIKFTYFSQEGQLPINILVLSNGLIKMSGHVIQDFEDFKNIVEFHKQA